MIITNLRLYNFRNYEQLNIDFSNNLNIIYGNNGTGKSNLIEAIYLLSLSKSFRTMDDKNLIRKNNDVCLVKGVVDNKTYFIAEINNKTNLYTLNDEKEYISNLDFLNDVKRLNIIDNKSYIQINLNKTTYSYKELEEIKKDIFAHFKIFLL